MDLSLLDLLGAGGTTDLAMNWDDSSNMRYARRAANATPNGAPRQTSSSGNKTQWGPHKGGGAGGGSGAIIQGNPQSFSAMLNALAGVGNFEAMAPYFLGDLPGYRNGRIGAQRQEDDIRKGFMGAQEAADSQRSLQEQALALQNAKLRQELNPPSRVGGGIAGLDEGMAMNRAATQNRYQGKSAYQRADEEKDFQTQLAHERMSQNLKASQALQLLSRLGLSGGTGGLPAGLTTTEQDNTQQIVNNAGRYEPRDLVATRSTTQPINPLDILRMFL